MVISGIVKKKGFFEQIRPVEQKFLKGDFAMVMGDLNTKEGPDKAFFK